MKTTLFLIGLVALSQNSNAADYTLHCQTVRDSSFYFRITGEATVTYSNDKATGIYDAFVNSEKKKTPNPIKSIILNYSKGDDANSYMAKFPTTGLKSYVMAKSGIIGSTLEWNKPSISISQFALILPTTKKVEKVTSNLDIKGVIPSVSSHLISFEIHDCTDNGLKEIPQSLIDAGLSADTNTQIGYEF